MTFLVIFSQDATQTYTAQEDAFKHDSSHKWCLKSKRTLFIPPDKVGVLTLERFQSINISSLWWKAAEQISKQMDAVL